jgi:hypothetical protein
MHCEFSAERHLPFHCTSQNQTGETFSHTAHGLEDDGLKSKDKVDGWERGVVMHYTGAV